MPTSAAVDEIATMTDLQAVAKDGVGKGRPVRLRGEIVKVSSSGWADIVLPHRTPGGEGRFGRVSVRIPSRSARVSAQEVRIDGELKVSRQLQCFVEVAGAPQGVGPAGPLSRWRLEQARLAGVPLGAATRSRADVMIEQLGPRGPGLRVIWAGGTGLEAYKDVVANDKSVESAMTVAQIPMSGANAVEGLIHALAQARTEDVDLFVVARGGGDRGDLAIFDDARLVRAIRECAVPVACAIGHESDMPLIEHVCQWVFSVPKDLARPLAAIVRGRSSVRQQFSRDASVRRQMGHDLGQVRFEGIQAIARAEEAEKRLRRANQEIARLGALLRETQEREKASGNALWVARSEGRRVLDMLGSEVKRRVALTYRSLGVAGIAVVVVIGWSAPALRSWKVPTSLSLAVVLLCGLGAAVGLLGPLWLGSSTARARGGVADVAAGYVAARTVRQFNRVEAARRGLAQRPTVREMLRARAGVWSHGLGRRRWGWPRR